MPNNQQGFDLKALKTDPKMWMRLAMPSKNGKYLENVFKDKENPFEKNNQAAVETLEKLAAEGKLYLRDFGRSRHFHKVEKTGEELKLGAQHEIKLSNSTAGFGLSVLMRMSRAYFKWIGLDGISNWFDGRLKRRSEIKELNNRYKEEYKSLTSEEKAELKALRKREENLKKLDEAKVRANATKKNLDAIRGKETTETLEELEAMLAKADQRAADNQSPEKQFARRALYDHEENLQKVGEARKNANEKKKTLDALRGKETTETLEQLEQMLSNANQIEQRRGGPLSANARKARKALRDYVKSLRELEKTEKKAEVTKKKLDETLGRKTTETVEQLKAMLGISPEEVNERRAIRRHVENLRKLAEAEKKAEVTKQKQDEPQNVDSPKTKGEMDSPLSQPPTVEQKENTMQPTLLGDQPVQQIPPAPPLPNQFAAKQTTQQEIPDTKKEENEQGEKTRDNKITINGVELTEETVKQFPPQIVEAFKLIQQHINEKEAKEKTNQQPVPEPPPLETQPTVNENKQENPAVTEQTQGVVEPQVTEQVPQPQPTETEQKEGVLIDLEDFQQNTADKKVPDQEIDSPLKNGADLEPEQVNVQGRPKDQAQTDLQERLAAEKQAMDAVQNWKDFVANSLFSHEEGRSAKEFYQNVNKNNEAAGAEYLSGAVFGILSNRAVKPEQKQQVMDALLSGKPLGSENAKLIDDGIKAYNDAIARKTSENPERLVNMLADSMRELGHQASRETTLSPRLVMIGRLLSNAAQMTKENNLELPIDENEFDIVKGAGTLADVAQKYHDARQRLGNDFENISSKENRGAVRDLLMGNAVEKMIQQDKRLGQTITNAQMIMGKGLWEVKKLQTYTSDTATRRGIQPEDIQAILKKPNSTKALGIGTKIGNEVIKASMEDYNAAEKAMQKEMELGQQENQVGINPIQMPV